VLSFGWVEFQEDMGWTGKSWILSSWLPETTTQTLAGILFILSSVLFVISGVGILTNIIRLRAMLLIAAILSTTILLLFWDGQTNRLVQKGLIGVLINILVIFLTIIFL
jgi:hypothetical protein